MSESEYPKPKAKPQLYSSIDAWQRQQEAKSEAQKADIPFQTPEAVQQINAAVVELQSLYREAIERLDRLAAKINDAVSMEEFHSLRLRVKGLEDKRGPGRPPKVVEEG